MIKLLFATTKPIGRNREHLRRHISEVHGPLVVKARQVSAPMYRYVQHHSMFGQQDTAFGPPTNADCDLVVEMIYESVEALSASRKSRDFHEIVEPDEKNIGDFKNTMIFWVKEVEIVPGAQWPMTLYHFFKRKEGLSRQEFQTRWREEQARLVPGEGPKAGLRRYLQNHVLPSGSIPFGTADEGMDILDEYRFEDLKGMAEFGTHQSRAEKLAAVRAALTDVTRSFSVLTQSITFIERP
jgi:EthD domain